MHIVHCTSCTKQVGVPEGARGRHVRCPLCKNIFLVAGEERLVPPPETPGIEPSAPLPELSIEEELAALPPPIEPHAREVPELVPVDDLLPPPTREKEETGTYALLKDEDEEEDEEDRVQRRRSRPVPPRKRTRRRREDAEPSQPLQPLRPAGAFAEAPAWSRGLLLMSLAPLGILLVTLLASASDKISVGTALVLGLGLSVPLSLLCVSVAWLRWGALTVQGRMVLSCLVIAAGYLLALLVIAIADDGRGAKKRSNAAPQVNPTPVLSRLGGRNQRA
jgi:LSD1 subclass zinc finger protein